jgi:acetoin utilization deacetylase AcuC-like enzyme
MPAGATGDVYRHAIDAVVAPYAAAWAPTWLLVSAGFDAHRRDPLTGLGLTSGDFADLAAALAQLVPAGRQIYFLEGGYDLDGLAASVASTLSTLAGGTVRPEEATAGGPGTEIVDAVRLIHERLDRAG